ncbi:hypothetical protein [Stagnihabitans tardus]|uniref:Uncharacterized protein n=1 Tax=Stagnihabitans tardus TaxID=2699202 RepID=A0AAE4YEI2_9RHOB|nr:hypothetical protein [Stagnihabitans tardus]NBZ89858.1 hypothetical protein [Stagnihabitans tardus]
MQARTRLAALLLAALSLPAQAQERPDPMVLIEPTPRLPCSGTEPACKINAALLALDQDALMLPCGLLDDETIAAEGLDAGRNPLQMWYSHWVDVTFQGADFYGLLLQTDAACPGGAHGWSEQDAVLFDLKTGEKVDPFSLLPAELRPETPLVNDLDPEAQGRLPPLTALYLDLLAKTDPTAKANSADPRGCTSVITSHQALTPLETMGFLLYPDAASQALILKPSGLPHVATGCEIGVPLSVELLQGLGADPRLVADLARAAP